MLLFLLCLVVSELPGHVLFYLTLTWGNCHHHFLKYLFCFFPLLWLSHQWLCYTFHRCLTVHRYSDLFFFFSVFSLLVSFGSFYCNNPRFRESLLSCVQCTNDSIKSILPFCCGVFFFLIIAIISLLLFECPSLCLCYSYVLACCLLFSLKPLAYFKILIFFKNIVHLQCC